VAKPFAINSRHEHEIDDKWWVKEDYGGRDYVYPHEEGCAPYLVSHYVLSKPRRGVFAVLMIDHIL